MVGVGERLPNAVPEKSRIQPAHIECGRYLILQREVAAHGVGSVVVELDAAQGQTAGIDQSWIEWSAREANLQRWRRDGAPGESDGVTVVRGAEYWKLNWKG